MRAFVLKRLAGFVPTLLLVLLAVFGVVNAVPAVPPASMEDGADQFRASYDAFRRQFSLHLPTFLNFDHCTTEAEVRRRLAEARDVAAEGRQRMLRDLWDRRRFVVPGLIAIVLDESSDPRDRDLALAKLPDLQVEPFDERLGGAERERAARAREAMIRLRPGATIDDAKRARLTAGWRAWWSEHAGEFELDRIERLWVTLAETRFATFVHRLAHLDFGLSMMNHRPVLATLLERLENTFLFTLAAFVLSFLLAIPVGGVSALLKGTLAERAFSLFLFFLYSVPTFFAATLLLRLFTIGDPFDWFPTSGMRTLKGYEELGRWDRFLDGAHHLVLPTFCLVYGNVAVLSRYARASVVEALSTDYVRTARAKGLPGRVVLFKHALRNGLLPIVTILGDALPMIVSGAVILEIIFDIPGIGRYVFDAILNFDYNAVIATTMLAAVITLVGYLLSDLLYAWVDPRIRVVDPEPER